MKGIVLIAIQLLLEIVKLLPKAIEWFKKTPQQKSQKASEKVNEDISKEQKNKRPGPGGVFTCFMLVCCGLSLMGVDKCQDPISPEQEQFVIDTKGADCAVPPAMHSNQGQERDATVLEADGFYTQSQAVESLKRKKYLDCEIALDSCLKPKQK
jgi:hypothetical protein